MPTNRTRTTRTRSGGAAGIANAVQFYFTILRYCGKECRPDFFCKMEHWDLLSYWKKNEAALLPAGLELMRQRNRPAQRPFEYFLLRELKHPRRKIGINSYIGPVRADGGDRTVVCDVYEDDAAYLGRLGLLQPWEEELLQQQAEEEAALMDNDL